MDIKAKLSSIAGRLKTFYLQNKKRGMAIIAAILVAAIALPVGISAIVAGAKKKYALTVSLSPSYGGVVETWVDKVRDFENGGEVAVGRAVTVNARANDYYRFAGFVDSSVGVVAASAYQSTERDGQIVSAAYSFKMINGPLNIAAVFEIIPHGLTVKVVTQNSATAGGTAYVEAVLDDGTTATGNASASAPYSRAFKQTTNVKLTAHPIKDHGFEGWYAVSDGAAVKLSETEKSFAFTIGGDENYEIEARFYKIENGPLSFDETDLIEPIIEDGVYVYKIETARQLALAAYRINNNENGLYTAPELGFLLYDERFELANDINLYGAEWTPIVGRGGFTEYFDGKGYEITNFKITEGIVDGGNIYAGFFGRLAAGAVVKDLALSGAEIKINAPSNDVYAGALVGYINDASAAALSNISVSSANGAQALKITVTAKNAYVGGILGYSKGYGLLENLFANVDITVRAESGEACVGGVAGLLFDSATRAEGLGAAGKIDATADNCVYGGRVVGKLDVTGGGEGYGVVRNDVALKIKSNGGAAHEHINQRDETIDGTTL
ncbi:MAG: hypothetical protein LBQ40_03200 [Clostridiales bacterium]|jgi:hypothetical protein|nr:hypothetical protein [Clostridiales bacterium]